MDRLKFTLDLDNFSKKDLIEIIKKSKQQYFNTGISNFTDQEYDRIVLHMKKKYNYIPEVGYEVHPKEKVNLPYHMGSISKIETKKGLIDKWLLRYKKKYVVTDKLDGNSALFTYDKNTGVKKLYKRGNNKRGTDISSLIKYLPSLNVNFDDSFVVRGELIISKENYEKYKHSYATPLSLVTGLTNTKHNLDTKIMKDIDFVVFELLKPRHKQSNQFILMKRMGFIINYYEKVDFKDINEVYLSKKFKERRVKSEYNLDGIVITIDRKFPINEEKNPKYSFAYKEHIKENMRDVFVSDVSWRISKDDYIIPTVHIEATKIDGSVIRKLTGKNAAFIVTNKIGPGAIIKVTKGGGVIPDIIETVKEANMIRLPKCKHKWDDNNVHFVVVDREEEDMIDVEDLTSEDIETARYAAKLAFFFKKMDIKNIGPETILKMVNIGIKEPKDIIKITKNELSQIPGFKTRMVNKIYNNIQNALRDVDLVTFAAATNIFGRLLGAGRLQLIYDEDPEIFNYPSKNRYKMTPDEEQYLYDRIINNVKGFSQTLTDKFVIQLPIFREEVDKYDLKFKHKSKKGDSMKNIIVVFSGFRDNKLKEKIVTLGGKVNTSLSGKTNYLVIKKDGKKSSKLSKAKDLNIDILFIEDFKAKFNL